MQTEGSNKRLATIATAVVMAAFGIGIGVGFLLFQPGSSEAAASADANRDRVARLEASIAVKDARYRELLEEVSGYRADTAKAQAVSRGLEAQIDGHEAAVAAAGVETRDAESELKASARRNDALQRMLADADALRDHVAALSDAITPMELDRLLLIELRRSSPDNLEDAEAYWREVKVQAVAADPTLGVKVDRVIRFLPTYFDWLEGDYEDSCESLEAYFDTGAAEYGTLAGDLQSDVYLLLINRIDVATGVVAEN